MSTAADTATDTAADKPADKPAASASLSLAYSVDADDAFMFHAVRAGLIDTHGLAFRHRRADTAALNRLALDGGADVVAISAGVYPRVASAYQLLPHGASVGRGSGRWWCRGARWGRAISPACASASPG